jgi:beta-lactamase class A
VVAALIFAAAIAQNATLATNDVANRIGEIEKRTGARIGVAAHDMGNGKRVEHRANERFLMCSTFKFLAAAAILKNVDEGKDDLSRFVRYGQKDILEYAPVTKQHLAEGGMRLGDLCAATIEQSDNTAGNLLLQSRGGPAGVTAFVRALGDNTTRLDRMEPELNTATPGDERDTTTPAAMEHDVSILLLGNILSSASRQRLDEWLSQNETGAAMIRAGVPKDWTVGDKTGRGPTNTNDIAIIRPPGRPPVVLTIYVEALSMSADARNAMIAEVAQLVAESL